MASPLHTDPTQDRPGRWHWSALSLQAQLPLLVIAVLALALATLIFLLGRSLESAALESARERLGRATRQIASISATSVAARQARYLAVARSDAVRKALRGERVAPEALSTALERASLPDDNGMPVQLWGADGRRLGWSGNDVAMPAVAEGRYTGLPLHIARTAEWNAALLDGDSLRLSPMMRMDGAVYLWFVQPIRERGRTIGFITHQRRPQAGPATLSVLSEMTGSPIGVYYRNMDGSVWANSQGAPVTAPPADSTARMVVAEERIGASPVMVAVETTRSGVLTRARAATRIALLIGAVVLLLGALFAWIVARNMARPLADLTRAAGTIAAGDYSVRAPVAGSSEMRRLAGAFNHMGEQVEATREDLQRERWRAESASSAKSEFLAIMSHELRTPLNAISGYVDLLMLGLRGPLTDEQRRDLERIRLSQQHLLGLISRVLDLARVESGMIHYDITRVVVNDVLAEVSELVTPQAAERGLQMRHDARQNALAARADRERLRQILLNLLSNAIRHTPDGGSVSLSAERRGDECAIVVSDTGPGIPVEKREQIFEAFVQLDRSLSSNHDGLGLGLAISRDLARGMGGELVIETPVERGARFVLTLPLDRPSPGVLAPPPPRASSASAA